jgi:Zn-finger nucleic acid-binding protein
MICRHYGSQIEFHQCAICAGIWCHADNLGELEAVPMLDVVDDGDPKIGALYDRIIDIACPVCATPMTNYPVPGQAHINVETCERCAGIFLDAGELTDAKHHTVVEWIRDATQAKFWRR